MRKTVLITGCSSGIGKAAAKFFANKGWNVAATMRSPEKECELSQLANIICLQLDVTKPETIKAAIEATIKQFNYIDVIVNNAGYGMVGPFEAAQVEKIKQQFETNVFGVMAVMRTILPYFRQRQAGLIINVTSMGGQIGFPLYSIYNSTKWAVEGFSEAVHYELEEFNIRIKLVEPGVIKTDFYGRSADKTAATGFPDYDDFSKRAGANDHRGITPDKVAQVIYKAATDKKNKFRYIAGNDARQVSFLKKLLPDTWLFKLLKRILISKK